MAQQEFRVVIDGLTLSKEATASINRAVQRAVSTEIAQLDLNKGDLLYHLDPKWRGIYLRQLSAPELDRPGVEIPQQFGR